MSLKGVWFQIVKGSELNLIVSQENAFQIQLVPVQQGVAGARSRGARRSTQAPRLDPGHHRGWAGRRQARRRTAARDPRGRTGTPRTSRGAVRGVDQTRQRGYGRTFRSITFTQTQRRGRFVPFTQTQRLHAAFTPHRFIAPPLTSTYRCLLRILCKSHHVYVYAYLSRAAA